MTIINTTTFVPAAKQPDHGLWIEGTVNVTLRGETRRVKAHQLANGNVRAYGMTGRYQAGTKAWSASVEQRTDPRTGKVWDLIEFGRDDRAAKFQKINGLHFA